MEWGFEGPGSDFTSQARSKSGLDENFWTSDLFKYQLSLLVYQEVVFL